MVATILAEKYRVLTNDTGSNFVRGAITATVEHARWSGRLPYDVAVFELDEAWAVRFVEAVAPRRALLLNVMRDQLDRFGEIDTTARLLGKVAAATTGNVVLNRDDDRIAALADQTSAEVSVLRREPRTARVLPHRRGALRRSRPLRPAADHRRTAQAPRCRHAVADADRHQRTRHRPAGRRSAQRAERDRCRRAGVDVRPGRGDRCGRSRRRSRLRSGAGSASPSTDATSCCNWSRILPVSDRHYARSTATDADAIVIVINDDYADGRDVSWLWDVDFARLGEHPARVSTVRHPCSRHGSAAALRRGRE